MGNVQMEADQIRYKDSNGTYRSAQTAIAAALTGGGGLDDRVEALEETVGDGSSGLVKDVDDLETAVALLNPNIYSDTETKIGKWGSDDLYRAVFHVVGMPANSTKNVVTGLSGVTIKRIYGTLDTGASVSQIPYEDFSGNTHIVTYVDSASFDIVIKCNLEVLTTAEADIILEYTKNPSPENNNR